MRFYGMTAHSQLGNTFQSTLRHPIELSYNFISFLIPTSVYFSSLFLFIDIVNRHVLDHLEYHTPVSRWTGVDILILFRSQMELFGNDLGSQNLTKRIITKLYIIHTSSTFLRDTPKYIERVFNN
jgi:hypothetical protein